jgi:hypothetical protein
MAARRYCEERRIHWCNRYESLQPHLATNGDYSDEERATFPRYRVLAAILIEVERIVPEAFESMDHTRAAIVEAALHADRDWAGLPSGDIEVAAMDEEREQFTRYIRDLPTAALASIQPLPFRRTLNDDERDQIRNRIGKTWPMECDYFWPLQGNRPAHAIAFNVKSLDELLPDVTLRSILMDNAVSRIFELREYGPEYEIAVESFRPFYNGAERFWTCPEMDWLIYASHDSTMTFVGKWLTDEIRRVVTRPADYD